jgi:hypothetical protein
MNVNTVLATDLFHAKSLITKYAIYQAPQFNQNIYTFNLLNTITQHTSVIIRILDVLNIQNNNQMVSFELFINGIMKVPNSYIGLYKIPENKIDFLNGSIYLKDCKNALLTFYNGDKQIIYSSLIKTN